MSKDSKISRVTIKRSDLERPYDPKMWSTEGPFAKAIRKRLGHGNVYVVENESLLRHDFFTHDVIIRKWLTEQRIGLPVQTLIFKIIHEDTEEYEAGMIICANPSNDNKKTLLPFKTHVTRQDIVEGEPAKPYSCPIAISLNRTLDNPNIKVAVNALRTQIERNVPDNKNGGNKRIFINYIHEQTITEWIQNFDEKEKESEEIEIRFSEEWIGSMYTTSEKTNWAEVKTIGGIRTK